MAKRFLLCLLTLALFSVSARSFCADEAVSAASLARCSKVYAYSGSSAAYFYGYCGNTLISQRVIPDVISRSFEVSGRLRAVCHDEKNAYALYERSDSSVGVLQMNMDSGSCVNSNLVTGYKINPTSFAVAGGETFLIDCGGAVSCAVGFRGEKTNRYAFSQNVEQLFVNAGSAYVKTVGGEVYRIGGGSAVRCLTVPVYKKAENAGFGYVRAGDGIYSLDDGNRRVDKPNTVMTADGAFEYSGIAAAAAGGKTAVLRTDFSCAVISSASEGAAPQQAPENNTLSKLRAGEIKVLTSETTVAAFLKMYPEVSAVYGENGSADFGGKIKTGCRAAVSGGECTLAVRGDLNSNGAVNSADVKALMEHFASGTELSAGVSAAADFNSDGAVDNRDLVLLAQSIG